jgi:hypothetical protein
MLKVDGRYAYAWKGFLFRAKDGVLQYQRQAGTEWATFNPDDAAKTMPAPDEELRSRLPDLLTFWDKDAG